MNNTANANTTPTLVPQDDLAWGRPSYTAQAAGRAFDIVETGWGYEVYEWENELDATRVAVVDSTNEALRYITKAVAR